MGIVELTAIFRDISSILKLPLQRLKGGNSSSMNLPLDFRVLDPRTLILMSS